MDAVTIEARSDRYRLEDLTRYYGIAFHSFDGTKPVGGLIVGDPPLSTYVNVPKRHG
jgi:hypothetical protein